MTKTLILSKAILLSKSDKHFCTTRFSSRQILYVKPKALSSNSKAKTISFFRSKSSTYLIIGNTFGNCICLSDKLCFCKSFSTIKSE